MDFGIAATVFGVIFAAELPDKTMVATLILSTRYPHVYVWLGVAGAFLVQVAIAVAAGGLLSLAPARIVAGLSALLFGFGAWLLIFKADAAPDDDLVVPPAGPLRAMATSFVVLFLSEWGDLSQLATAGFAARFGDPVSVFAGSFGALATVAGLAVVVGRSLLRYVHETLLRRIAGSVLAVLAVLAAIQALGPT